MSCVGPPFTSHAAAAAVRARGPSYRFVASPLSALGVLSGLSTLPFLSLLARLSFGSVCSGASVDVAS